MLSNRLTVYHCPHSIAYPVGRGCDLQREIVPPHIISDDSTIANAQL